MNLNDFETLPIGTLQCVKDLATVTEWMVGIIQENHFTEPEAILAALAGERALEKWNEISSF